ncbi:hypothetical protein EV426DRAFT_311223 [Tirmania nivea]|nr:hypothetical protein EV426DRAFT_311223 [Tirmania nivea]
MDWKLLILTDSKAAVAALRKAGRRGKARTRDLRKAVASIKERHERLGAGAVRIGWVKAHVGIPGNERADVLAKEGAEELFPEAPQITEGGLRQEWKRLREAERKVAGTGGGRVVRWGRKARVNYVHCRTGKWNLQSWRAKLDDTVDPTCRSFRRHVETGKHVALSVLVGKRLAGDGGTGKRWMSQGGG